MSDGSQQGISAKRAIQTIIGGKPAPKQEEERTPAFWYARLKAKSDDIRGYEAHAEVMAKYIIEAYEKKPELKQAPISRIYKDKSYTTVSVPDLADRLKEYYQAGHPFCLALSEATGFTWGWAFNIARYAMGLPPQPNPAICVVHIK